MNRFKLLIATLFDLGWIVILSILLLRKNGQTKLIVKLLNPEYWWLLWLSLAFFSIFFLLKLCALGGLFTFSLPGNLFPRLLSLCVPVLFLPLAFSNTLGAETLSKRTLATKLEMTNEPDTKEAVPPEDEVQEVNLANLLSDDMRYMDNEIAVVGMVNNNPDLPENTVCLFRFFSSCCAADAFPAGILVALPKDSPPIEEGSWVRFEGTATVLTAQEQEFTGMNAASFERVDQPADPIIYVTY